MANKYVDADLLKREFERTFDMQDLYLPAHFFDVVDSMPYADVQEVRHGKWKDANETFECSICGYSFENEGYMHFFNFCPCCGARMDGDPNA